jgi:hypothetical protein
MVASAPLAGMPRAALTTDRYGTLRQQAPKAPYIIMYARVTRVCMVVRERERDVRAGESECFSSANHAAN